MRSPFLVSLFAILLPASAGGQAREPDLPYGSDPLQRLDIVVPATAGFPTVIFVHGGSLTSGDKADDDYRSVCDPFPARGVACVSVNYRLAPAHHWPAPVEDVAAAVAWVRKNIAARGGDPRKLVLLGHSSGATLVALLGSDGRYLAREGLGLSDIAGVIPMGSIMWDDDLEQAIDRLGRVRVEERFNADQDNAMYSGLDQYFDRWPMRHVKAGMPPFLFLIAEEEQEQPPVLRTNRAFVERSRSLANRAEYRVLPGRDHYSAVHRLREPGDIALGAILGFIQSLAP